VTVLPGAGADGAAAIRVMIVDDHPIWREAVEADLRAAGYNVVAALSDGAAAVRLAPAVRPEVVLMDVQLPLLSGAEATAALTQADPSVRVLMFSASGEDGDVLAAVTSGARGYLTKSASRAELLDAVGRTAAGEAVFSPGLAALVLGAYQQLSHVGAPKTGEPPVPALTEREREVLRLAAKGLTARQIAEHLVLSHRTVQNHIQNTLRKLQLRNKVELTRWAIEQGL
jgi:DNA-binding NarL/FixJ family response regulator